MSRWTQVMAVGLAAVVGLVPMFAQPSYAETVSVSQTAPILPVGEEMEDAMLADVVGEAGPLVPLLAKAAKWVGTVLLAAEKAILQSRQKAVLLIEQAAIKVGQAVTQAATKVGELTLRGVTLAGAQVTQHPLLRDTVLGMATGLTGEAIKAGLDDRPLTLRDVGFALGWGGVTGAGLHGVVRGLQKLG